MPCCVGDFKEYEKLKIIKYLTCASVVFSLSINVGEGKDERPILIFSISAWDMVLTEDLLK